MQSGLGKNDKWVIEFETKNSSINPLMGWESSSDTLSELKLEFCGFSSDAILRDFKQIYSDDKDLYNLEKWNQFEELNQNAFITMYQFWCQRLD